MVQALRGQELLEGGCRRRSYSSALLGRELPLGVGAAFSCVTPFLPKRSLAAGKDLVQGQTLAERHVEVSDDQPAQDLKITVKTLVG